MTPPVAAATPSANVRLDAALALALALVTFLVAAYFAPRGFRAGFTDMAHDGYQLQEVIDLDRGAVIFKDTFDQYGPLAAHLNLAGFRMFGRTMLAVKYAHAVWYAASAVVVFLLARQLLPSLLSAVTVLFWLALAPFYQHGIMVSPHTYILFFQNLGALAVIRFARTDRLRDVALAGLCAGICWALKTSMGIVFVAGVGVYLLSRPIRSVVTLRRSVLALTTVIGCALSVVAATLVWLWARGALHDWYLQTVEFPRAFYVQGQGGRVPTGLEFLIRFVIDFFLLNFGIAGVVVSPFWHLIRVTVVIGAVVLLRRRSAPAALLVPACLAPFLWIGAYPSANFMHQWWTVTVALPAFVYCVDRGLRYLVTRSRWTRWMPVPLLTTAAMLLVFWPGIRERAAAGQEITAALSERIEEPRVLSGVRTDRPTAEAFGVIYRAIQNYRQHHPGVRVVSNDHCDGMNGCVAESLLWLSFLDDNRHDYPVFWPMPILTTTLYPEYSAHFAESVRTTKPLIVDSWQGPVRSDNGVAGYELLVGVRTTTGYWYVFAPVHEESVPHGEVKVRLDLTKDLPPSNINHAGGRRAFYDEAIETSTGLRRALPLYSWPGNVEVPPLRQPDPLDDGFSLEYVGAIGSMDENGLALRGPLEGVMERIVAFKERIVENGDYFVATGEVETGGCQLGLLTVEGTLGYTSLNKPGPFQLLLKPQRAGTYRPTLDCFGDRWWQVLQRDGIAALPRVIRGVPNSVGFVIRSAGWVSHDSSAPIQYTYQPSVPIVRVDMEGERPPPMGGKPPAHKPSVEVIDARTNRPHVAEVYRWPAAAGVPADLTTLAPAHLGTAAERSPMVGEEPGAWVVDHVAETTDATLLRFAPRRVLNGQSFVATGVLQEGGVTFEIRKNGMALRPVQHITKPGWFAVILTAPETGDYELAVANHIRIPVAVPNSAWPRLLQRVGINPPDATPVLRSRFRIQSAGWTSAVTEGFDYPGTLLIPDAETGVDRRMAVYTFPPDLAITSWPAPRPIAPAGVAYTAPIVKNDRGRWVIDGVGETPFSYLLELKSAGYHKGARFAVTGSLDEGGFTVGLLHNNAWSGFRNVTDPGWFAVTLQIPEDGEYSLVIANNLPVPPESEWREWVRWARLGALLSEPEPRRIRFQLQTSGWID